MRVLLVSHRLATEQCQGAGSVHNSEAMCLKRWIPAVSAPPCSRLRCVSFQGSTSPATGKQPVSRQAQTAFRPSPIEHAASSGQQQPSAVSTSKTTMVEQIGVQSRNLGSTNAAAGEQIADRIQASEDTSTSGREYWQVSCMLCEWHLSKFRSIIMTACLAVAHRIHAAKHKYAIHWCSIFYLLQTLSASDNWVGDHPFTAGATCMLEVDIRMIIKKSH